MKIKLVSDLHLEFHGTSLHPTIVPESIDDKDTVLVLAGDIGLIDEPYALITFVERMCEQFRKVIYVLGNHEYYYDDVVTGANRLKSMLTDTPCTILDNESVVIDNVMFIGATLWTDMNNDNPLTKMTIANAMSDFAVIGGFSTTHGKFTPDDAVSLHRKSKEYIVSALSNKPSNLKSVVITHHLPSFNSLHPQFSNSAYNDGYCSNLDSIIYDLKPDFWFHGHTHCSMDYQMGNTRVVCNPRGYYPDDLNQDFNPGLVILI